MCTRAHNLSNRKRTCSSLLLVGVGVAEFSISNYIMQGIPCFASTPFEAARFQSIWLNQPDCHFCATLSALSFLDLCHWLGSPSPFPVHLAPLACSQTDKCGQTTLGFWAVSSSFSLRALFISFTSYLFWAPRSSIFPFHSWISCLEPTSSSSAPSSDTSSCWKMLTWRVFWSSWLLSLLFLEFLYLVLTGRACLLSCYWFVALNLA